MDNLAGCLITGQDGKQYRLIPDNDWEKLGKPLELPSINIENPIGEQIQSLRENSGLSQKELATSSGLTPAQLCRIEKGQVKKPHRASINAILYALATLSFKK